MSQCFDQGLLPFVTKNKVIQSAYTDQSLLMQKINMKQMSSCNKLINYGLIVTKRWSCYMDTVDIT